jgi:hypothetical protein
MTEKERQQSEIEITNFVFLNRELYHLPII